MLFNLISKNKGNNKIQKQAVKRLILIHNATNITDLQGRQPVKGKSHQL